MSTIKVLENIQTKMNQMKSDELSRFKLDNTLGGQSEIIHLKAIQRIYCDRAKDFIDGLKQNPSVAVPLVLKRLKAKDEEWREAKKNLEKTWREQIEKNYLKSLDYCAAPFKQNDQKYLKTKSLINEIESIYYERNESKEEAGSTSTVPDESKSPAQPVIQHNEPHMMFKYDDKSILEDAAALIIHHVKRQTAIQKEDKQKIKQIVYHFLPDLFFISRGALSDDESAESGKNHPPSGNESEENGCKKLRSNGTGSKSSQLTSANRESSSCSLSSSATMIIPNPNTTPTRHTDTNKRRLTDVDFGDKGRDAALPSEYKSPDDLYRLFYVDEHWYLFFRYHQIMCDRLYKIYRHALQAAEQESADAKMREQSVADALKLRNKSDISVDDYYPAFLDIVRNLLDGNMDSVQYEDTLREMFGIHAYIAFTLDKVVHNCVRQVSKLNNYGSMINVRLFIIKSVI